MRPDPVLANSEQESHAVTSSSVPTPPGSAAFAADDSGGCHRLRTSRRTFSADSLPPLVIGRECGRPSSRELRAGESRRHFFLGTNTTWVGCIRADDSGGCHRLRTSRERSQLTACHRCHRPRMRPTQFSRTRSRRVTPSLLPQYQHHLGRLHSQPMTVEGVIGCERVGERLPAGNLSPLVVGPPAPLSSAANAADPVLANSEQESHAVTSSSVTNTTWVGCIRSR